MNILKFHLICTFSTVPGTCACCEVPKVILAKGEWDRIKALVAITFIAYKSPCEGFLLWCCEGHLSLAQCLLLVLLRSLSSNILSIFVPYAMPRTFFGDSSVFVMWINMKSHEMEHTGRAGILCNVKCPNVKKCPQKE